MAKRSKKERMLRRIIRARRKGFLPVKHLVKNGTQAKNAEFTFLDEKWLRLRYEAFRKYGKKCQLCGASDRLHVDHIKPKSRYPALKYDINNLQILCHDCNIGKSYIYTDDWRGDDLDELMERAMSKTD